jgi:radical SAM superfamily enzyme YgiQ (UPF0313 family)
VTLSEPRTLTRALMVMLAPDGLRLPGLDTYGGQEKHASLSLGLPELLLIEALSGTPTVPAALVDDLAQRCDVAPERLLQFLQQLDERALLVTHVWPAEPTAPAPQATPPGAVSDTALLGIATPRFFKLGARAFEHVDHEGRVRARLSAVELAAASAFRGEATLAQALAVHAESCGALALGAAALTALAARLIEAELLQRMDDDEHARQARAALDAVMRRGRAIERERFQTFNEAMRQRVRDWEAAEQARERATGHKRIKVVSVQQNGTIFPLALGMIVAAAQEYDGGRLHEHYAFHPDWLVRPSKVRGLTREPGVFLFSNYAWSHHHNMMVSRKVKQASPGSLTIHGGPNTPKYDIDTEAYFQANPDVDVAVRGEGEAVVAEVLAALAGQLGERPADLSVLSTIPGLAFRDGTRIVRTPERARIADLDALPSPILSGLFDVYTGVCELGIVESNRGCPYSCTFCDWGSAIGTRIRKFSLERVFAELEWCAAHQVDGIMCADANFGIFERDVLIAEKVAELKARYGYPTSFSCNFAKNTTTHLKRIIEILTGAGVISTSTIAVQSMDPGTLKTIRRSNIKVREYDALTEEFRKAELPLFMDLMFGLPGQTLASFRNDLQGCIDRGLFPRMYMTELLVNSPMNEPAYRELHRIVTEPSADGSRHFVVSTASFTRDEYEQMNALRRLFVLCDIFGVLREVAHFVRGTLGMREIDFYESLARDVQREPERWPILSFSIRALPALLVPPASWALLVAETRRYLVEVLGLQDDSALATVLEVQLAVLPGQGRARTLTLAHDYLAWHRAQAAARAAGHHADWHALVPRLADFGPATLGPEQHADIGTFGIGPALYGVQPETSVSIGAETLVAAS